MRRVWTRAGPRVKRWPGSRLRRGCGRVARDERCASFFGLTTRRNAGVPVPSEGLVGLFRSLYCELERLLPIWHEGLERPAAPVDLRFDLRPDDEGQRVSGDNRAAAQLIRARRDLQRAELNHERTL